MDAAPPGARRRRTPLKPKKPDTRASSDPLTVEVEGLTYTLDRPPSKGSKKAILTVTLEGGEKPPLVDRVDL